MILTINVKLAALSFVAVMIIFKPLQAQNRNLGVLELIHADELKTIRIKGGKQYRKASGDVLFRRGDMDMRSDEVEFLPNLNWAKFKGNVVITDPNRKLTSSEVIYRTEDDLVIAYGNVVLTNLENKMYADTVYFYPKDKISIGKINARLIFKDYKIHADEIRYDESNNSARAKGNSILTDIRGKTELRANIVDFFIGIDSVIAFSEPQLTKVDSATGDTLFIRSKIISGNTLSSTYYARDSVKIDLLNLHAESQKSEYNPATGIITLLQDPFVEQGEEKLTGDKIIIFLENQKVTQIYVPSNAKTESRQTVYIKRPSDAETNSGTLVSKKKTVINRLNGNTLRMYIEDNQIKRVVAGGMASSDYFMTEDSILQGLNKVSGDTIVISFLDSEIRTILVMGGAIGEFQPDKYAQGTDTTINYSSGTIIYDIPGKTTRLRNKSTLKYQDMTLNAHEVNVNWTTSILIAKSSFILAPDSIREATGDSLITIGLPELIQKGSNPVTGTEMEYNLITKRGKIKSGITKFEDGYYTGETILKLGPDVMAVSEGYYTTCDLDHPHFFFKSKQMKIMLNNKVIARPIVLYISDVPLFALPFGIFPNKAGRHSGLLLPSYGETSRDGRYLRGGGLYWAGSQYHDATLIIDFLDKRGLLFRGSSKYSKRYVLNGSLSGSLTPRSFDNNNSRRWDLNWNHRQTISPTMNLNGRVRLVSDERFYNDLSSNRNSRLDQQLISNLTIDKKWEGSGNALSLNLSRTENLQTNDVTEVFPSFNFRVGRKQLFGSKKSDEQRWYNSLYYSYSNRGERKRIVTHSTSFDTTIIDTGNIVTTIIDTIITENENINQLLTHSITLNSPQKVLKYFSVSPNIDYNEKWIDEWNEPQLDGNGRFLYDSKGAVLTTKRKSFKTRRTFSTGITMSTKLYGNFSPHIGQLSSIRHVMTPSIGFRFTPDFSSDTYGYFANGLDPSGNALKVDYFTGSAIGATPSRSTKILNYSVRNIFQAKLNEGEENESKLELLSLNFNGSYDYNAIVRPVSPLSASIRTQFIPGAKFDISSRYNFYKWLDGSISEVFIGKPRLTNFSIRTSFTLRGSAATAVDNQFGDATDEYSADDIDNRFDYLDLSALSGNEWSSKVSLSYSLNKTDPDNPTKSFWFRGDVKFNPTRDWAVGYNYNLDLIKKTITNHSVNIRRDLHCWQFSLNWTPSGPGAGYYLLINVKSFNLKDLKIEERGGRSSLFGR